MDKQYVWKKLATADIIIYLTEGTFKLNVKMGKRFEDAIISKLTLENDLLT